MYVNIVYPYCVINQLIIVLSVLVYWMRNDLSFSLLPLPLPLLLSIDLSHLSSRTSNQIEPSHFD